MKIGIICYPGVSYVDIAEVLSVFEQVKNETFSWEFCSYLPMKNGMPGLSLSSSYVGLPLASFDRIILPSKKADINENMEKEWFEWLETINQNTKGINHQKGFIFAQKAGLENQVIESFIEEPLSGILAGLSCIQDLLEEKMVSVVSERLFIKDVWEKYQNKKFSRIARVERKSAETEIAIRLELDGTGQFNIDTGVPFVDHMLAQVAKHGNFDLNVKAVGDIQIDPHHTMEDVALALGEAFRIASGERKGIQRMSSATVPMDESLASVTVDFSGRPYCVLKMYWKEDMVAEIPTSLIDHFLESFAYAARCNLFIQVVAGNNNHHMSEAVFKALARALDLALTIDPRRKDQIPSTKQVLF